jgi:hypothetical protein
MGTAVMYAVHPLRVALSPAEIRLRRSRAARQRWMRHPPLGARSCPRGETRCVCEPRFVYLLFVTDITERAGRLRTRRSPRCARAWMRGAMGSAPHPRGWPRAGRLSRPAGARTRRPPAVALREDPSLRGLVGRFKVTRHQYWIYLVHRIVYDCPTAKYPQLHDRFA